MTRLPRICLAALPALLLATVVPAGAQNATPGSSAAAPASSQARQGSLIVEPISRDTFVIAPDVKVTQIDHSTRTLVGGYGGLLIENTLLLGAGGYWLADNSRDREMAYGGFVAQWTAPLSKSVRVGVRGLIGGGQATLARVVSFQVPTGFQGPGPMGPGWGFDHDFFDRNHLTFTTVTRNARFRTGFFVAEPQADLVLQVTRWLAVDAGAGYRAVAYADGFERQLRGAVGSLGIRIGRI